MNYEDPKDKEFIIKLVQEYIDLQDQRGEGFSIIYTQDRIKKQFETLNSQIKKEIKRIANRHKEEKGKELTIYNCFNYYLYNRVPQFDLIFKYLNQIFDQIQIQI